MKPVRTEDRVRTPDNPATIYRVTSGLDARGQIGIDGWPWYVQAIQLERVLVITVG